MDKKVKALFDAAGQIIDDFENYGEVLQVDEDLEYGPESAIKKLTRAWLALEKEL